MGKVCWTYFGGWGDALESLRMPFGEVWGDALGGFCRAKQLWQTYSNMFDPYQQQCSFWEEVVAVSAQRPGKNYIGKREKEYAALVALGVLFGTAEDQQGPISLMFNSQ